MTKTYGLPDLLRDYRLAQDTEGAHVLNEWRDLHFVFAQRTGAPIDSRAAPQDLGVTPQRLGSLTRQADDARHTAAATLLIMGVRARVVMQILGTRRSGSPAAPTATS